MRVIKSGNANVEWTYTCGCRHCGAILEVSKSDVVLRTDQRDGNYYVTHCPECKNPLTFLTSRVGQ